MLFRSLQRFALLQSNFCQTHHPPTSTIWDKLELIPFVRRSAELIGKQQATKKEFFQLLQLRVLRLCFLQDGDVGVGVLPEGEEIFVSGAGFGGITCYRVGATELKV